MPVCSRGVLLNLILKNCARLLSQISYSHRDYTMYRTTRDCLSDSALSRLCNLPLPLHHEIRLSQKSFEEYEDKLKELFEPSVFDAQKSSRSVLQTSRPVEVPIWQRSFAQRDHGYRRITRQSSSCPGLLLPWKTCSVSTCSDEEGSSETTHHTFDTAGAHTSAIQHFPSSPNFSAPSQPKAVVPQKQPSKLFRLKAYFKNNLPSRKSKAKMQPVQINPEPAPIKVPPINEYLSGLAKTETVDENEQSIELVQVPSFTENFVHGIASVTDQVVEGVTSVTDQVVEGVTSVIQNAVSGFKIDYGTGCSPDKTESILITSDHNTMVDKIIDMSNQFIYKTRQENSCSPSKTIYFGLDSRFGCTSYETNSILKPSDPNAIVNKITDIINQCNFKKENTCGTVKTFGLDSRFGCTSYETKSILRPSDPNKIVDKLNDIINEMNFKSTQENAVRFSSSLSYAPSIQYISSDFPNVQLKKAAARHRLAPLIVKSG